MVLPFSVRGGRVVGSSLFMVLVGSPPRVACLNGVLVDFGLIFEEG